MAVVASPGVAVLKALSSGCAVPRNDALIIALYQRGELELSPLAAGCDDQMITWLARLALSDVSHATKRVARVIAGVVCDPESRQGIATVDDIAAETGLGARTVRRAIRILADAGVIEVIRRTDAGGKVIENGYRIRLAAARETDGSPPTGALARIGERLWQILH